MSNDSISVRQLGSIVAYDENKQANALETLWAEKTAVLVFVRHFG